MIKFIFKVRIKKGYHVHEYVAAWKKGSAIIQKSVGARGTILYGSEDKPRELVAIAEWASKASRDVAIKKLRKSKTSAAAIQRILKRHKKYGEIIVLGNFKEIAKVKSAR